MLPVNSRETTFEHQRVPAARFNNISLLEGVICRLHVAGRRLQVRILSTHEQCQR